MELETHFGHRLLQAATGASRGLFSTASNSSPRYGHCTAAIPRRWPPCVPFRGRRADSATTTSPRWPGSSRAWTWPRSRGPSPTWCGPSRTSPPGCAASWRGRTGSGPASTRSWTAARHTWPWPGHGQVCLASGLAGHGSRRVRTRPPLPGRRAPGRRGPRWPAPGRRRTAAPWPRPRPRGSGPSRRGRRRSSQRRRPRTARRAANVFLRRCNDQSVASCSRAVEKRPRLGSGRGLQQAVAEVGLELHQLVHEVAVHRLRLRDGGVGRRRRGGGHGDPPGCASALRERRAGGLRYSIRPRRPHHAAARTRSASTTELTGSADRHAAAAAVRSAKARRLGVDGGGQGGVEPFERGGASRRVCRRRARARSRPAKQALGRGLLHLPVGGPVVGHSGDGLRDPGTGVRAGGQARRGAQRAAPPRHCAGGAASGPLEGLVRRPAADEVSALGRPRLASGGHQRLVDGPPDGAGGPEEGARATCGDIPATAGRARAAPSPPAAQAFRTRRKRRATTTWSTTREISVITARTSAATGTDWVRSKAAESARALRCCRSSGAREPSNSHQLRRLRQISGGQRLPPSRRRPARAREPGRRRPGAARWVRHKVGGRRVVGPPGGGRKTGRRRVDVVVLGSDAGPGGTAHPAPLPAKRVVSASTNNR